MRAVFALMRGITALNERVGRFAAYFVLLIFALLFTEVLLRYFFRSPTVWTNEFGQLLFGAYAVLSGGYLLARGGHVNVDILYANFPRRTRASIDVFTSILFFAFVGILLWQGSIFALESVAKLETSQSAWNPSIWMFKLTIPIGAGLLLLQGTAKLIGDILVAVGGDVPDDLLPGHEKAAEAAKDVL
jgi:TRAP-type mannitol/chloroaromatic compound transport system permease small subunit